VALSTVQCVFLPNPSISIGRGRQNLVLLSFFLKKTSPFSSQRACLSCLIDRWVSNSQNCKMTGGISIANIGCY